MLYEAYEEASLDLADEMEFLLLNSFDAKVISKLVTAMFNLKEIEGELHYGMTDQNEVEAFANKCVIHILLSPVSNEVLCDADELEEYMETVVDICMVNQRLKYAILTYKLINTNGFLEHECGRKSVQILEEIKSKVLDLFS